MIRSLLTPLIRLAFLILLLAVSACAPRIDPAGPDIRAPALMKHAMVMPDGAVLPMKVWGREIESPKAILLALHGFNDYSNAYHDPALFWESQGIRTYAIDQRGFGQAPNRGIWAGSPTMRADLVTAAELLRHRYPDLPLVLIGESMGAAVSLTALTDNSPPDVDRTILSAPAVLGKQTLPFYKLAPFWFFAHTIPWLEVRPRVKLKPSDNIEMLRALGRDPLIIKRTRIDAAWGLLNLMTEAQEAGAHINRPVLILFGRQEELIPGDARERFLKRLPNGPTKSWHMLRYESGYHMLMRDLNAKQVWQDIAQYVLTGRITEQKTAQR